MSKKNPARTRITPAWPRRTEELPATQKMLKLVRTQLKSETLSAKAELKAGFMTEIGDLRFEMNSRFNIVVQRFNEVDQRFNEVDQRFNEVDQRFNQADQRFDRIEGVLQQVLHSVHRIEAKVTEIGLKNEEQDSRNQVVLEALVSYSQIQARVEARVDRIEKLVDSTPRRGG